DPMSYTFTLALGSSHLYRRALPEAATWLSKSTQQNPRHPAAFLNLASALAHLGRLDEARVAMATVLNLRPTTGLAQSRRTRRHQVVADFEYMLEGARMAGLPE